MQNNKMLITTLFVFSFIMLVIGSTLAYWTWTSNNLVAINITTNMGNIGLLFNGGTTTIDNLAPARCTHSTYSNQIPLTIERYNETEYPAMVTLSLKLSSFTWNNAKPTSDDLSHIYFAITNKNNTCDNSFTSGTLINGTTNNTISTAQAQNTTILTWDYILPENSGTSQNKITENYYLYVWLDPEYTFNNNGNNQIQDPLQDISFTITWDASNIEQIASRNSLYKIMQDNANTQTTIDFSNTSEEDNTLGIYTLQSTATDTFPVYFYRGAVTNNNVYFGEYCWKAVRTTSTGGVKLIYNGLNTGTSEAPACNNTGTNSQIGTSTFNDLNNSNTSSPSYAGYMYGTSYFVDYEQGAGWKYAPDVTYSNGTYTLTSKEINGTTYNVETKSDLSGTNLNYHHYTCGNSTATSCSTVRYVYTLVNDNGYFDFYLNLTDGDKIEDAISKMFTNSSNTTSSTIKTSIDTWYSNNMINFTQYLEDTPYCNDRSIYSLGGFDPNGGNVIGNHFLDRAMIFLSYHNIKNTYSPNVTCRKNDSFTVNKTVNGNGNLTYPVALLTADEAMLAGGRSSVQNSTYYLYTGQDYWSMSLFSVFGNINCTYLILVSSSGNYSSGFGSYKYGIRPVISLKNTTVVSSGNGTVNSPYIID